MFKFPFPKIIWALFRLTPKGCRYALSLPIWCSVIIFTLTDTAITKADLIPVSLSVTPTGSDYNYSYNVELPNNSILKPGDFFTIYDFAGYIPKSNNTPASFQFSSSNLGPTPSWTTPSDNPSIPNLTWTYEGPQVQVGALNLGIFSAQSVFGETVNGFFTAETHTNPGDQVNNNITATPVPVPCCPEVPEPTTFLLGLLGLPIISMLRSWKMV